MHIGNKKVIASLCILFLMTIIYIVLNKNSFDKILVAKPEIDLSQEKNATEKKTNDYYNNSVSPTFETQQLITPTATLDPIYNLGIPSGYGSKPEIITTDNFDKDVYLYKDAIVTIKFANDTDVYAFLNLDDLSDNDYKKNDLTIEISTGNISWYQIYPVNSAQYYYSGEKTMDYDQCMGHFPLTGFTDISYEGQGLQFDTGNSYCFISGEGKLAIVSLIKDSIIFHDDNSRSLSILVTVYK